MQPVPAEAPTAPHGLDHLGLIAGDGDFPFLLARAARDRGISVSAIGVNGITPPSLADSVDRMGWVDFGKINRLIQLCHEFGISKAIMAGRIHHSNVFQL